MSLRMLCKLCYTIPLGGANLRTIHCVTCRAKLSVFLKETRVRTAALPVRFSLLLSLGVSLSLIRAATSWTEFTNLCAL